MSIVPRKISRHPNAATPTYWFDGKGFESLFFNAVSSTFPEGERFFVLSVRNFAEQIQDEGLKIDVARFMRQEGQHSREHDAHMRILDTQGFGMLRQVSRFDRLLMRWTAKFLPRYALAVTTAVEHVTALAAVALLENEAKYLDPMHEDYRLMWHWHAVEEIEHKAVTLDVFEEAIGSYTLRVIAALYVAVIFPLILFIRHLFLLAKEGLLFDVAGWCRGMSFLLGREGFLTKIAVGYSRFFRRNFNPANTDDSRYVVEFEERYGMHFSHLPAA